MLQKLKAWAMNLKRDVLALWFARAHADMPLSAKILAALVVAYAFSPIDLIPDFIPLLGYLDELVILPAGIYLTLKLVPPHVLAQGRSQAEEWLAARRGKPVNYYAAALIVALWLALAWWLWRLFAG
jgi:uncharacterized membrane protein YkvA (DUF1232 family)